MKTKTKELDVDFIGGQVSLTEQEERRISEFIQAQKKLRQTKQLRIRENLRSKKVIA